MRTIRQRHLSSEPGNGSDGDRDTYTSSNESVSSDDGVPLSPKQKRSAGSGGHRRRKLYRKSRKKTSPTPNRTASNLLATSSATAVGDGAIDGFQPPPPPLGMVPKSEEEDEEDVVVGGRVGGSKTGKTKKKRAAGTKVPSKLRPRREAGKNDVGEVVVTSRNERIESENGAAKRVPGSSEAKRPSFFSPPNAQAHSDPSSDPPHLAALRHAPLPSIQRLNPPHDRGDATLDATNDDGFQMRGKKDDVNPALGASVLGKGDGDDNEEDVAKATANLAKLLLSKDDGTRNQALKQTASDLRRRNESKYGAMSESEIQEKIRKQLEEAKAMVVPIGAAGAYRSGRHTAVNRKANNRRRSSLSVADENFFEPVSSDGRGGGGGRSRSPLVSSSDENKVRKSKRRSKRTRKKGEDQQVPAEDSAGDVARQGGKSLRNDPSLTGKEERREVVGCGVGLGLTASSSENLLRRLSDAAGEDASDAAETLNELSNFPPSRDNDLTDDGRPGQSAKETLQVSISTAQRKVKEKGCGEEEQEGTMMDDDFQPSTLSTTDAGISQFSSRIVGENKSDDDRFANDIVDEKAAEKAVLANEKKDPREKQRQIESHFHIAGEDERKAPIGRLLLADEGGNEEAPTLNDSERQEKEKDVQTSTSVPAAKEIDLASLFPIAGKDGEEMIMTYDEKGIFQLLPKCRGREGRKNEPRKINSTFSFLMYVRSSCLGGNPFLT